MHGGPDRVHPSTPERRRCPPSERRKSAETLSTLATLATAKKHLWGNSSDAACEPVNREPDTRAHTWISNIGGQVGQGGPEQQRRGFAAVHPRAGRADKVDTCRFCGERIPASAPAIIYADRSLAHVACYERAASKGPVF